MIESFKESHATLAESVNAFPELSRSLWQLAKSSGNQALADQLAETNLAVYRYLESEDNTSRSAIENTIPLLKTLVGVEPDNDGQTMSLVDGYQSATMGLLDQRQQTQQLLVQALDVPTGELLDELQTGYTEFHNDLLQKSETLRNTLIIYGFVLLGILGFFAFLLRKNFVNLEQKVAERTRQIKESQEQLIQSEKMASLGELVAGVAHEVNTPLGYVSSNVETLQMNFSDVDQVLDKVKQLWQHSLAPDLNIVTIAQQSKAVVDAYAQLQVDDVFDESQELLHDSRHGLEEISGLIQSLKDFSRLDRQSTDHIDVHDCIDSSLRIATNKIKECNVSVEKHYRELPKITCMPSKLNQLFLNVITNAAQAMKDNDSGGTLSITTGQQGDNVVLQFQDEGVGMDEETMKKMFDPFFTTKPIGEGTGLGMSISYKIVQSHQGDIAVDSEPGKGTTIRITLPIESE